MIYKQKKSLKISDFFFVANISYLIGISLLVIIKLSNYQIITFILSLPKGSVFLVFLF